MHLGEKSCSITFECEEGDKVQCITNCHLEEIHIQINENVEDNGVIPLTKREQSLVTE